MSIQRTLADIALATCLLLVPVSLLAAPSERGQELHEASCLQCHGSEIYTRDERLVTSLDGLKRQVQRCESALGLTWFDEDIADVAAYLNHHFYQFEQ